MNARDDEVRAAARLLESRLQQAPEQPPAALGHDWRPQESPRVDVTAEGTSTSTSTLEYFVVTVRDIWQGDKLQWEL